MGYKQLFNPIIFNMKFSSLLLTLLVFLSCFAILIHAEQDNNVPRGVAKSEALLYEKKGSEWTCLDGSATIPYESINDDYCDCTSACPNGRFYCTNVGYIPAYVSSKRVNDGVCEPECCDGSDEYDGKIICLNTCKELANIRVEGARIRQEYIQYGITTRQEQEASLGRLKILLDAAKIKVSEREAVLKRAQEMEKIESKATVNGRLKECRENIRKLQERNEVLHERIDTLLSILEEMKNDHNQNYNDVAVETAIIKYNEFVELYGIETDQEVEIYEDEIEEENKVPEIQTKLSLSERVTEAFVDLYDDVLEAFGLSEYTIGKSERQFSRPSGDGKSKEVTVAYDALNEAKEEIINIENETKGVNEKLARDYGPQQEFAKLDETCINHVDGQYTYTVCLYGKITQKSSQDYRSTHLGNFEKWIGSESKDDPKYYTAQLYDHGARCWNGPDRSIKIYFECGIENKILAVSEPENCEYVMNMTTPSVCSEKFEKNKNDESIHDEL
ncbi:5129_t:CDS:10 [Funneliformis geosporum]|uniref:Glucosidase 2 subunit beta n=1 Tax=Funneliformis geosporum TaxID=1117311 RepID=A0A9W4WK90_9GLOM|nr:4430_t:CDS:10 [Funneliformis geosporum]CAI2168700.1 5129_t:CDS:10 [Funneliformis geosporum]